MPNFAIPTLSNPKMMPLATSWFSKLKLKTIKVLNSDRGGEHTSNAISSFCEENGIVHDLLLLIHLSQMALLKGITKPWWRW